MNHSRQGPCVPAMTLGEQAVQEYTYMGRVEGAFFDREGQVTDQLRRVLQGSRRAKAAEVERKSRRSDHPGCNKRWSEAQGARSMPPRFSALPLHPFFFIAQHGAASSAPACPGGLSLQQREGGQCQ